MEAKCAALAAENAGLKAAAEFATAPDMWEELGGGVMRYQYQEWYADKLKSAMETPVTDAFLAEVRAQGVDIAIAELNQLAQRSEKEAPIAAEHHRSAALYLQLFAAQLRQEAAK